MFDTFSMRTKKNKLCDVKKQSDCLQLLFKNSNFVKNITSVMFDVEIDKSFKSIVL